jgi:hypothetical protein
MTNYQLEIVPPTTSALLAVINSSSSRTLSGILRKTQESVDLT